MSLIRKTLNWYGRFERPISSLSLIWGFVFDALTLKRVDALWENLWILGHILIVGLFIILIHIKERGEGDEANPSKAHFWFVNILQFFFGGLLSTFLVFYFRSTDIFATWPFLFILALAFVANDSFKRHYTRFSFQISLFFLSIYSFMIFLVPVVLHKIGDWVFLLSGLLSLILIIFFIVVLFYFGKDKLKSNKRIISVLISGLFVLINFLYFTNLIPPIPLSLKDGGVYHSVQRNSTGNYDVTYEDQGWKGYFQLYENYDKIAGSPIYAFSAIFSPTNLNITIIHEWQHYDTVKKEWNTESTISLPIIGGRDSGFRTYSKRSDLAIGKWRVNIKTLTGKTIGRLRFNIIKVESEPILKNDLK
jgi:hypothetical protein